VKIWIQPSSTPGRAIDWPEEWRIPAEGELLLLDGDQWIVDRVQWEINPDGEGGMGVQLRVRAV